MAAVAGPPRRAERGQRDGEVRHQLGVAQLLGRDVRVERFDPDAVGEVALELRGGAREHDVAPVVRAPAQLGEQPCLADPRLALDRDAGGLAAAERVERRVEARELGGAADDRIREPDQGPSLMSRTPRTRNVDGHAPAS